jgi:hypothetical protein
MSKYVYEQFVTPDQREKMTVDASGVRKGFFGAAKLQSLTPEKRLNVLYSAIRDVEGNENHPIVQALQQHIEKSGVEASVIQDIITTAKKDFIGVSAEQREENSKELREIQEITEAERGQKSEQERLAREQEERQKSEQERLAREQEERQKSEQERLAREQEERQKSEQERLAREQEERQKSEQERLAREQEQRLAREEAQDNIILGSTTEKGQSKVTTLSSSEVDPITEAIRKEILAEQQKVIKAQIALIDDSVGRMNPQEFREYLTSDKGKEEAAKVFTKPDIQTALNKIEVEGYRKVHTEFSESFKNVNWTPEQITAPGQPKTKTSEITNENGMVVAKIKETTHDIAPLAVTLDNGDQVNVKSYRTIDFPTKLETGTGPLHLSMAVKDQNGRNISEKDAVYFTAHYDEQGKLTEISSPIPVKFMGNDDNAVGYIERNGKVYTLPVTKKTYNEMMKEVAKNQGMSLDLSQEVAKETQDLALTKEKAKVSPALEKNEEVIPPKQKSEDLIDLPKVEPLPLQVVDLQRKTAQEKTTAIDDMLRGASPDQIVATLKDQVAKGGSEAVELIVEATKSDRLGDHPDVPTLTAKQFQEVYETGMKAAKSIAESPPNPSNSKVQKLKMENILSACTKLASPAGIEDAAHKQARTASRVSFGQNNPPQIGR